MSSDNNVKNKYAVSLVLHDHKDKKEKYKFLLRVDIIDAISEFEALGLYLTEILENDEACKSCALVMYDIIKI